uniref:Uncharacterized protein n=1 Tax=Panagrolaimus sp. PS1159 TaxID=55785 RepID=A0AC35FJW1_9BILA
MTKISSNIVDLFYGDYSKYASNYISLTNALTIYKPVKCPTDYAILLFRAVNAHTSNCLFKKTIYNIGSTRPQINLDNIIAMHALNQPLAMKGLKEFYIHGHSKKPVIMYSGLEDKVHILNFSETETKPWKKIYLGAMFYTVLIPRDSSLLVKTFETYNLPRCTFGNDPFCSFIDTPYFGNPNTYKYQKKQIGFYIILCNPIIFTIQTFDVSKNGRLWFEANNNVTIEWVHLIFIEL